MLLSACTAIRRRRPSKLYPSRFYTERGLITFLGSISARLLAFMPLYLCPLFDYFLYADARDDNAVMVTFAVNTYVLLFSLH